MNKAEFAQVAARVLDGGMNLFRIYASRLEHRDKAAKASPLVTMLLQEIEMNRMVEELGRPITDKEFEKQISIPLNQIRANPMGYSFMFCAMLMGYLLAKEYTKTNALILDLDDAIEQLEKGKKNEG